MTFDVASLAESMLAAARIPLGAAWNEARPFAQTQFTNIAQQIVAIKEQRLAGTLTEEQAVLLLDMQTNASRSVLLTIEGIGLLAAQDAINAALAVVTQFVNTALGFALL